MPPRNPASGRTQQGYTPSPSPAAPGSFRPPARRSTAKPAATTKPKQPSAAQIKASQRQSAASYRRQQRSQAPPRRQQKNIARQAASASRRAAVSSTDYQKVIAAEFAIAELLVAATPFASKKATGLSPYVPRDMTKMLALGGVYFLLELLSIPAGWGRMMAWFGGLILLTVGLNEAANITKDIDIFAGINPKSTKP